MRKAIEEWRISYGKEIPRESLQLHEQLGAGSFKRVYRGTLRLAGRPGGVIPKPINVAVLRVHTGNIAAEADILLRLSSHPRLVQLLGVCKEGDESLLVMEFAALGDMKIYLEEIEDSITVGHKIAILQQLCSGMEAVSAAGLIHRDLALRNVLVLLLSSLCCCAHLR